MKKKTTILTLFIPLILFSETLSLEENLSLKIEELTTVKQGNKLLKKLKADFIKKNISTYNTYFNLDWTSKNAIKNIKKVSTLSDEDIKNLLDSSDYFINLNPIIFLDSLIKISIIEEKKLKKDIKIISKKLIK
jgi:hypothetical protein